MPERQRGRDPDKDIKKRAERSEQDKQPYRKAVKYPSNKASELPYDTVRDTILAAECNLSAMRMLMGPQYEAHVAVWGDTPAEGLLRRIDEVLAQGEAVELPSELWEYLKQRRAEMNELGERVEKPRVRNRRRLN
jgi:hypothetical protein